MKDARLVILLGLLAVCTCIYVQAGPVENDTVDIPLLEDITIDADAADWGTGGFQVDSLYHPEKPLPLPEDFDPRFRLAWNKHGLLLLTEVSDDIAFERGGLLYFWTLDEIVIKLATAGDVPLHYSASFAPGVDSATTAPAQLLQVFDDTGRSTESLQAEVARAKTPSGYRMELLLPWDNLDLVPERGDVVLLQIYFNDNDARETWDENLPRHAAHWNSVWSAEKLEGMNRLRLAEEESPPELARLEAAYDDLRDVLVTLSGAPELVGQEARLACGESLTATVSFGERNGRSFLEARLPVAALDGEAPQVTARIEGCRDLSCTLPDLAEARARALVAEEMACSYVFRDEQLPEVRFKNSAHVFGDLLGPCTTAIRYFDAEFRPVTKAEKPGRYGAILEVTPENGRTIRRYVTLFRCPPDWPLEWWNAGIDLTVKNPARLGMPEAALARQAASLQAYVLDNVEHDFWEKSQGAVLMAGLFETSPEGPLLSHCEDAFAMDRQWWATMKRRNLRAAEPALPFVCPRSVDGAPAPVLREGPLAEAGVDAALVRELDAICQEWADKGGSPHVVCLSRNGVIFLHKAYGPVGTTPPEPTQTFWIASTTKLLSGIAMMMLVDQGLVNLDDPVSKYLPIFDDAGKDKPLILRQLYTHTSGLDAPSTWENDPSMEEKLAEVYPFTNPGLKFAYNWAGIALGSRIVETVTGESLPFFYKRHLFDPLGCEHIQAQDSAGGGLSSAIDLARIGQMLVNGGAYGAMRFMEPETVEAMKPVSLRETQGIDTDFIWGIGMQGLLPLQEGYGFCGHGGASGSRVFVNPSRKLVVAIARPHVGKDFSIYNDRMIEALARAIPESR